MLYSCFAELQINSETWFLNSECILFLQGTQQFFNNKFGESMRCGTHVHLSRGGNYVLAPIYKLCLY